MTEHEIRYALFSSYGFSSTVQTMFGMEKKPEPKETREMKLYEVAVIMTDNTGKSEIIVPPTPLLAANEDAAKLQAGRKIPRAYDENLGDMKVLVRPFC